MKRLCVVAVLASGFITGAAGQIRSPEKTEFEVASIHVNPPQTGFHFSSETVTGGPGTADPGMFRCTGCTLATLIAKAFELRNYQLPGRAALPTTTFDVMARVPSGATPEAFQSMLQNLLKDRFGLQYHFTDRNLKGYHLTVSPKGSKLHESADNQRPAPSDDQHRFGGDAHSHASPMNFHGSASFRRDHQTTDDLARIISDQLNLPVDDQTGLHASYDIALTWTADVAASGNHAEGAWHGDHGGGSPAAADGSGPTIFEALQTQLGLQLIPANQTAARVLVIDRVQPLPTEN